MDPTTILGDTSSKGILRRIADMFAGLLPAGLGGAALLYLFNSAGGEDSFLKKLEDIPVIGSIVKFLSNAANNISGWISGLFNGKEGTTMNAAIAERLDTDNSFALAEKAVGIPGIGAELRTMAKESAAKGGNALDNAQALHKQIVAHIIDKWQDVNPKGNPANITAKADEVATGLMGIPDQANLPREVDHGYAGLLQQAKKAKDAEGTLTADQVKPISLSPELKALAEVAATPNAKPAAEAEAPVAPPKNPKLAALAAAGK